MSDITLGLLIEPGADAKRDAIHVAVAPVTSDEKLQPGEHVALVPGCSNKVQTSTSNRIGIVDPYLRRPVEPGQRFWLCLYLKTVTGLRHDWSHPAFKEEESKAGPSEQWIRNYAEQLGVEYHDLMAGARRWVQHGEYYNEGPTLEGVATDLSFWSHYEAVTGAKLTDDHRQAFFSCAC